MHSESITMLDLARLSSRKNGLIIEHDGAYLAGTCRLIDLEKDHKGRTHAAVRQKAALDALLSAAYGRPVDGALIWAGLRRVAEALQEGNLLKATLAATYLGLPQLPDEMAVTRLIETDRLLRANFNPGEPRDERGRWALDGGTVDASRSSKPAPTSTAPEMIAETKDERHSRCVEECLHLLPSPTGDLQSSEYRKCYRECMGTLN